MKNRKHKVLLSLVVVFLMFVTIGSVVAKDIAYITRGASYTDPAIINILNNANYTYDVIYQNDLSLIDFSKYSVIIVGEGNFNNPSLIPVNQKNSVIFNSYHLGTWGWTGRSVSTKASNYPSEIYVRDSESLITQNVPDAFIPYYKDNVIVNHALKFISNRRLDTAKYRPKTLWISLKDFSHKNRVVIPFYDLNNQIIFYQSRAIFDEDSPPKYKSKTGADKSLFNIEKIEPTHDKIYKIEGPIDASFVRNGVGMCGLNTTELQQNQLRNYPFHEQVWVLDNDINTEEVYDKYVKLLESGERVFIWPIEFKKFKDINEVCQRYKIDEFPHKLIDNNIYEGRAGILRLASLRL